MSDESSCNFTKKALCASDFLPTLKFSLQGGFIVGLKKFYHYLLEIEAEENFCQKSSTARALCNKNKKMLCFLAINKINRAITTL